MNRTKVDVVRSRVARAIEPQRTLLDEDVETLIEHSKESWNAGKTSRSLDHLRRALLLESGRADLWYLYGQRSIEVGQSDIAFDAIKSALDLRPWHLDAIELLAELVRNKDRSSKLVTRAHDRLVEVLPTRPGVQRGAVDILIPARHVAGIQVLAESNDPVARGAARLYLEERELGSYPGGALGTLSEAEQREATLIHALAVGKVDRAVEILSAQEPNGVTVVAVRRAIRRHVTRGQLRRADRLVDQYLRARPVDGWGLRVKEDVRRELERRASSADGTGAPNNYQLTKKGFPFSPRASSPSFEARSERVLYLLHNSLPYNSAGYATRSHGLLRQLSERWEMRGVTRLGFPFDSPGHDELESIPFQDEVDGVIYQRLTTEQGRWLKNPITDYVAQYAEAVRGLAVEQRPFLIHAASNHWNGLTAVEAARTLGIPSVYEVRGLWEVTRASRNPEWHDSGMYRYVKRMEADAARGADRVITITQGLRDEMIERGVDEDKIHVVPNGVDTRRFTPLERDEELAKELGLEGKTVIGYIGSVLDYEGLDMLVRAVAALDTRRDDFHLLIVGDGAEKEAFESLAEDLGVLGRVVTFTGRVPHADVERYYSLVDIAPFPRLPLPVCELVSPLKPFEAMAMGKAVVASDVRALAEIIDDGVNGLLHTKGDVGDLTRVIETLLDNPALVAQLGETSRKWVETERDWSSLADRVSSIYEELSMNPSSRMT